MELRAVGLWRGKGWELSAVLRGGTLGELLEGDSWYSWWVKPETTWFPLYDVRGLTTGLGKMLVGALLDDEFLDVKL